MTTLNVFQATMPSVNYVFGSGKVAVFIQGFYRTAVQWEIEELEREIANGHPHIHRPAKEEDRVVESALLDPMAALRAKIIAEYKAAELAATNPDRDMGQTDQNAKLMPGNTMDVAEAATGGSGMQANARLVNLGPKK